MDFPTWSSPEPLLDVGNQICEKSKKRNRIWIANIKRVFLAFCFFAHITVAYIIILMIIHFLKVRKTQNILQKLYSLFRGTSVISVQCFWEYVHCCQTICISGLTLPITSCVLGKVYFPENEVNENIYLTGWLWWFNVINHEENLTDGLV